MTQNPKILKPKRKEKLSDKEQSERFVEIAQQIETLDGQETFKKTLDYLFKQKN